MNQRKTEIVGVNVKAREKGRSKNTPANKLYTYQLYSNFIEDKFSLTTPHKSLYKKCFSIKDFFSKCDQIHRKLWILVTFTEEILNGKLHFCAVNIVATQKFDGSQIPSTSWISITDDK